LGQVKGEEKESDTSESADQVLRIKSDKTYRAHARCAATCDYPAIADPSVQFPRKNNADKKYGNF
jgi:hypothetical protein